MKDAMSEIYQVLLKNVAIEQATLKGKKHNIYYYEMPDGELPANLIIIRPYSPPSPAYSGSDKYLAQRLIFQIDVQSVDRMTCKKLQIAIEQSLSELGYRRLLNQELDEYFKDTRRYVDARRYQKITRIYDTNY
ncbi:MAG: hypothetical protein MRZ40_10135 [Ligilactobacillus animalis]|uniref:hypothetical protein n=1 Tax=Ligilactobacillus animalis TaxID=1605 RepID=UPI00242FCF43|nr:hypothetical protein [Ligilactobacillus animalis]MCI5942911.1 hypothetical protein [Ligilactobacillus animalis]MDY2993745.1 hypothetical protein [Ligilactobacillus animalis]